MLVKLRAMRLQFDVYGYLFVCVLSCSGSSGLRVL